MFVSVGGSVRWRFVWICSERWTITTEGGVGDDYADLAKIHRQWWLFVRICFVIKKLISTGSISASISVFLCAGFASCVCFAHAGHFKFVFSFKNKIASSFTVSILNKPNLQIYISPPKNHHIDWFKTWAIWFIQIAFDNRRKPEQGALMSEVAVEHCPIFTFFTDTLYSVLSNMLEVNCKHFDNTLLAGTTTDTPRQSVQGTLAVSTPLLMLRIINN